MESKEVSFCKNIFFRLGSKEKIALISSSNLTAREQKALIERYADGETVKAVANNLGMEIDAYNKMQRKAFKKFYFWLNIKARDCGVNLDTLVT